MSEQSNEYKLWKAMRWRCSPKNPHRNRYFDRGIAVCERWNSYESFMKDMGKRPSTEYSLDRIDNDSGYSPENCRWATRIEQTNNTGRTNYFIEGGVKIPLMEISRLTGIHPETLRARIKKGWSYEKITAKPMEVSSRRRDIYGQFI